MAIMNNIFTFWAKKALFRRFIVRNADFALGPDPSIRHGAHKTISGQMMTFLPLLDRFYEIIVEKRASKPTWKPSKAV